MVADSGYETFPEEINSLKEMWDEKNYRFWTFVLHVLFAALIVTNGSLFAQVTEQPALDENAELIGETREDTRSEYFLMVSNKCMMLSIT